MSDKKEGLIAKKSVRADKGCTFRNHVSTEDIRNVLQVSVFLIRLNDANKNGLII